MEMVKASLLKPESTLVQAVTPGGRDSGRSSDRARIVAQQASQDHDLEANPGDSRAHALQHEVSSAGEGEYRTNNDAVANTAQAAEAEHTPAGHDVPQAQEDEPTPAECHAEEPQLENQTEAQEPIPSEPAA